MLERYETLVAELGETRVRGMLRRRGAGGARRVPRARPRGPRRAGARRRGGRARRISSPLVRAWGGVTHRLPQADGRFARLPSQSRRGDQGARRGHHLRREPQSRSRRWPTSAAPFARWCSSARAVAADAGRARRAGRHAAGADGARRGRNDAEHHLREGMPGHVSARREAEVLPASPCRATTATAGSRSTPDAERVLHVLRRDGRFVTYYGDNHPALRRQRRQGDGVGEGRLSARRASCSRRDLASLDAGAPGRARPRVDGARRSGSTTSCWRRSKRSCG